MKIKILEKEIKEVFNPAEYLPEIEKEKDVLKIWMPKKNRLVETAFFQGKLFYLFRVFVIRTFEHPQKVFEKKRGGIGFRYSMLLTIDRTGKVRHYILPYQIEDIKTALTFLKERKDIKPEELIEVI
jgi:hypothetical protein